MKGKGNLSQQIFAQITLIVVKNKKKITLLHYTFLSFSRPTPDSSVDTGAELSEIDARLQALQEYMRDLDTGH